MPKGTLYDESEAKAAKRQVGEDGLFRRLAYIVTSRVVTVELEGEGKLSRFHILFELQRKETKTLSRWKRTRITGK